MSPVAMGSVSGNSLRVKRKGFVMTITLNRPEALNTLNLEAVRDKDVDRALSFLRVM